MWRVPSGWPGRRLWRESASFWWTDVLTTGATASACAQALLDAGAQSVFAVALATVEFPQPVGSTTAIAENEEEIC